MKVSIFEAIGALKAIAGEVTGEEVHDNIELLQKYLQQQKEKLKS